jgi:hypothetical protein
MVNALITCTVANKHEVNKFFVCLHGDKTYSKTTICFIAMQTYKELITDLYGECIHSAFSTDEDPGLRIESFAAINLRGVSTNKTTINTRL